MDAEPPFYTMNQNIFAPLAPRTKAGAPRTRCRRTGANHGQMLYTADGYVTAWLLWHLQGDEAAARAFTGAAPELASNPLYQDVRLAC